MRVAVPRQMMSTPLASGSSVPVWPTRRSPDHLRILYTMSCEVGPMCLLTISNPFIDVYCVMSPAGSFREERRQHTHHASPELLMIAFVAATTLLSTSPSLPLTVAPAAEIWPPPPNDWASFETSIPGRARHEILTSPSGNSVSTMNTLASLTVLS